ncbi:MAG: translation initiation factor IF-2, partial [Bacteroidetes bacterium]|nr:translation initiation factor IF-2 [Bacteroidota bacterium]
ELIEVELPAIEEEIIPDNIIIEDIIILEDHRPDNFIRTEVKKLEGPTILGRMELPSVREREKKKGPVASSNAPFGDQTSKKKKRKRIKKEGTNQPSTPAVAKPGEKHDKFGKHKQKRNEKEREKPKVEPSEEEIQKHIKETLAKLSQSGGKSKSSKFRRQKRDQVSQHIREMEEQAELEKSVLKVTEFVTVAELASMMNVQVTQIIATCMTLGIFVSINQRLDAETLTIVAEEFGFTVEFVSVELQDFISTEVDSPEDMEERPPIVTVMGHVDHGKTSLLDYIRKTNVIAGEAGGITQHIGAYNVTLDNGKKITFLDTPGHEAFTAMRARGAQVTDIAIIVIAADDNVMPQTVEAINHAQAAGVPIVIAINKIDKPGANPEKLREELAHMNILVEDWGGKYQCQEISAKKGIAIDQLLEKVLLEAEILELKANYNKMAVGTVLESNLDKGRGYIATALIEAGTLHVGDIVLAGCHYGKVKAMFNERNVKIDEAGPASPVLILGLAGAPQAGDKLNVIQDEKEAKDIAAKRTQLQREQGIRTQKHITLDEIGRRIAIGDFKELNIILKADVDGSLEALSDSLLKLSTQKIQVNVIHKSVGAVSETDVMLASASNAIIIAFQVRPSVSARKLAEKEEIDIRLYSVIYDAINEVRDAMEGMLSPEIEEKIICNLEVREVFKITKVGTIAGCFMLDGKIQRNTKVRVIRDGIVVYTGLLGSLKRFKDEVK